MSCEHPALQVASTHCAVAGDSDEASPAIVPIRAKWCKMIVVPDLAGRHAVRPRHGDHDMANPGDLPVNNPKRPTAAWTYVVAVLLALATMIWAFWLIDQSRSG